MVDVRTLPAMEGLDLFVGCFQLAPFGYPWAIQRGTAARRRGPEGTEGAAAAALEIVAFALELSQH